MRVSVFDMRRERVRVSVGGQGQNGKKGGCDRDITGDMTSNMNCEAFRFRPRCDCSRCRMTGDILVRFFNALKRKKEKL